MDMKEPSLSRESSASSCSRWFICWYSKLLYLGGKRVLEDSDLGDLREGDDSLTSYNKLMALWGAEVKKNGINIIEGGSKERDNIDWMVNYNKPQINPVLKKYSKDYNILTIGNIPSITVIKIK